MKPLDDLCIEPQYGRISKTINILKCYVDEDHRRKIGIQLNKGRLFILCGRIFFMQIEPKFVENTKMSR